MVLPFWLGALFLGHLLCCHTMSLGSGVAAGTSFHSLLSHALQSSRSLVGDDTRLPWEVGVWNDF